MSVAPASVLGIGAVTPQGRDLSEIGQRLYSGPQPAEILRVPDDLLADPTTSKSLRRADRFVKMAALAALDAWKNIQPPSSMDRVGLIVTSGLGPHGRGFKFLDGILDCGDAEALPTDFSHSVHGAAASYIAGLLDLRGPSLSTTDFSFGFEQAVLLAQAWLSQGTCDRVVVGAVEELGKVLVECAPRLLPASPGAIAGGLENPKNPHPDPLPEYRARGKEGTCDCPASSPSAGTPGKGMDGGFVLGEGAVFLTLAPQSTPGIATIDANAEPIAPDLLVIDEPMIFPHPLPSAKSITTFSGYFGQSCSSSALQTLGALLTITSPVSKFDTARTFRTSCDSSASILIKRTGRN